MRGGHGGAGRAGFGRALVRAVRLADVLARLRFGAECDRAEQTVKLLLERFEQRAARDVAVRDLLPLLVFELEKAFPRSVKGRTVTRECPMRATGSARTSLVSVPSRSERSETTMLMRRTSL